MRPHHPTHHAVMNIRSILHRFIVLRLAPMLPASCVTSIDLIETTQNIAKRGRGPAPESEWNALGIWRCVADQPATYIPKDYPASAPRGETQGSWIVDKRDGKRLFVPKVKVGDLELGVLMGEARKVSQWSPIINTHTRPGFIFMP